MPTIAEINLSRQERINDHRIFWEKVESLRRPAMDFIKVYEADHNNKDILAIVVDALDRLKDAMSEVVGCE